MDYIDHERVVTYEWEAVRNPDFWFFGLPLEKRRARWPTIEELEAFEQEQRDRDHDRDQDLTA